MRNVLIVTTVIAAATGAAVAQHHTAHAITPESIQWGPAPAVPVPLTAVLISYHIADDARRRLELVEFLARLGIHRFEITFERSIEHYIAGGGERA